MKKLNMKKTTTAAVAATVGAVLLLGGAGTLAYWSDDAKTAQQTISSGELIITDANIAGWMVKNGDTPAKSFDGKVVPGDTLTTTVDVPVKLVGQNIKGELVVAKNAQASIENAKVAEAVSVTVGGVNADKGITAGATAGTLVFAKAFEGTIPVTITIPFPKEAEVGMNETLKLGLDYTLTQK